MLCRRESWLVLVRRRVDEEPFQLVSEATRYFILRLRVNNAAEKRRCPNRNVVAPQSSNCECPIDASSKAYTGAKRKKKSRLEEGPKLLPLDLRLDLFASAFHIVQCSLDHILPLYTRRETSAIRLPAADSSTSPPSRVETPYLYASATIPP